ncbi:MAG: hydrogenase expression/formation protein [Promethearchaeota archaeon]|nr:MAG: hydrogenase expression/formation protein [Candidatus Lokiarchaeota archaeon]
MNDQKNQNFKVGKLRHDTIKKIIENYISDLEIKDPRVIQGSKIGEDAAVIDMGDKYLISKTDPITFATDAIGYYVVNVNINDVVCMGATPKWFQSTILLPEKGTDNELVESIFKNIHDTCQEFGISVIGGHTEVTSGLKKPIIVGSLLGEVDKDKLVLTSGAKPEDAVILTKGIFIEGTSIIGREKEQTLLKMGFDKHFIDKCKNYLFDPGISVYKEATLANSKFTIHSMHDPTEGGLYCGIAEIGIASNYGVRIDKQNITILPEPLELSRIFHLNPMNTISSGSLLLTINGESSLELLEYFRKNRIICERIGTITHRKNLVVRNQNGKIEPLIYSETDEIIKIFN